MVRTRFVTRTAPWLKAITLALAALSTLTASDRAHADEPVELRHDLRVELPATAALAAVVVGFRLLRDDLEPSHCRICDGAAPAKVNAFDDAFRSAFRHSNPTPANVTSYALAFGVAPLSAAGLTLLATSRDHRLGEALVDVVIIAEAGLTAMLVTEVLESSTLRMRPYVHAIGDEAARNAVIAETGAFHSFPAGHVVEAFSLAAASGTVASMRNYRLAPVIWGVGAALGVATAYTRVAADRHYVTDTVVGAAIGTLVGTGVPLLLHPVVRKDRPSWLESTSITGIATSQTRALGITGSF